MSPEVKLSGIHYIGANEFEMEGIFQKIDKLTNSIVNRFSGDSFNTEVIELNKKDLISLKRGWKFDWSTETSEARVFKLVIQSSPDVIQGLISLEEQEGYIFMRLVETARHNYGRNKVYEGVLGNLVAFACKLSFEKGFDGYVVFESKTKLVSQYLL